MEESQVAPRMSGLAIASFILAITCFGAPLALILGIIAAVQISKNASLRGHGLAVAGILLSLALPLIVVWLPVVWNPHPPPRGNSCLNNLKQIGTAMNMYESDWDDKFPLVSGPGREFERLWPDVNKPYPANLRTGYSGGERRWFQNLVAPYARNTKIFMCPSVTENGKWETPAGTIYYYRNRHGGFSAGDDPAGGVGSIRAVPGPKGSQEPATKEQDPVTSYWFNAVVSSGSRSKLVSGRSEEVCAHTADAPLVWDTPCGFDDGTGEPQLAHEDSMNVLYADGHARQLKLHKRDLERLRHGNWGLLYGSEGWF